MTYCSLAEAKAELKATSTADDDTLMRYVYFVCARIDQLMTVRKRPYFEPYQERRSFRMDAKHISSWDEAFWFHEPLMSLTSFVADETTITSLVEPFPQDIRPIRAYRFISPDDWYGYMTSDHRVRYAALTGLWGHHSDYANAWLQVDTLNGAISSSVTSLTVSGLVTADDVYGFANRISRGHLLQIGSSAEILEVTDASVSAVTVRRGVNGSTAEAHANLDAVKVFKPEQSIRRVVQRQSAMMYARRGAFQVEQLDGIGTISYPTDLLNELKNVLTEYMYS